MPILQSEQQSEGEAQQIEQHESEPPSDFDEALRQSSMPKQAKMVVAAKVGEWQEKIERGLRQEARKQ